MVSISNNLGYDTSFLHGAKNGSMGFQGFANTLGYDNYYGRDEFNNDEEYDGFWGIWDEPFLQFSKSILDNKLKDHEWITGEYSIADIAVYPWTMTPDRQGVELSQFDNVTRWKEQMKKRSAVAKGMSVGQEMRKNNQVLTDDEYSNLFGKNQYKKR